MQRSIDTEAIPMIDRRFNKFSQACVVLLSGSAFLFSNRMIVLIAALCLLISALVPFLSPFRLLYRYVLVPLRVLRPQLVEDDPAPHRFAQAVGATFLVASTLVLFLTAAPLVGWSLDLVVLVLSVLNFGAGFCAGCFVYYHLGRLGLLPRVRYAGGFRWRGV